jgi:hypothetical protein
MPRKSKPNKATAAAPPAVIAAAAVIEDAAIIAPTVSAESSEVGVVESPLATPLVHDHYAAEPTLALPVEAAPTRIVVAEPVETPPAASHTPAPATATAAPVAAIILPQSTIALIRYDATGAIITGDSTSDGDDELSSPPSPHTAVAPPNPKPIETVSKRALQEAGGGLGGSLFSAICVYVSTRGVSRQ